MTMKLFLIALALSSVQAFALEASDPQLVQIKDKHAVPCTQTFEGGTTSFVPTVARLGTEGGIVNASLDVTFQVCQLMGDEVRWTPRAPLDPVLSRDVDGNTVRTEFTRPELLLGDANFTRIQAVPVSNDAVQTVEFQFAPSDFLSQRELIDLQAGKPVRVRLSLLSRAIGKAVNSRGDETPLGYQFGGSYTFFLTLQK